MLNKARFRGYLYVMTLPKLDLLRDFSGLLPGSFLRLFLQRIAKKCRPLSYGPYGIVDKMNNEEEEGLTVFMVIRTHSHLHLKTIHFRSRRRPFHWHSLRFLTFNRKHRMQIHMYSYIPQIVTKFFLLFL